MLHVCCYYSVYVRCCFNHNIIVSTVYQWIKKQCFHWKFQPEVSTIVPTFSSFEHHKKSFSNSEQCLSFPFSLQLVTQTYTVVGFNCQHNLFLPKHQQRKMLWTGCHRVLKMVAEFSLFFEESVISLSRAAYSDNSKE